MSLPGTDSNRRAEKAAEQTGDYAAHNTASDAPAPAAAQADPLLSLLRPPHADGELGRLAHFAVTRLLGRGGMGAVFAADDLLLHRKVALKVMRPELTARPEARERFLREAQTAGGLEHDHVITVHHVAEDNGVWFIAMPLLKGEALDARLAREGRLPIPAVLKIGRETADGLAAAHSQGLIHRDIKPGNLWLEGTGEAGGVGFRRVKILDFGLARAVQDDQHLTADGGVLGTPAYMAPEQAAGEEVDHRTDLFSLGVVLYRCCAGELPFSGPNTMATLSALATKDAVPVGEKNPAVPAALADLIMGLLAKTAGDRPQSATEVAETLRRIEQEHATVIAQAPPPAPRRRRVSALTLCVAALLVLGLAAVAAVIVVKVRTPDGKETEVTAPTGSKVAVDPKGGVKVTLPGEAPAAAPDEITNSIGMKLKLIKPGTFTMGSPKEEEGRRHDEGPQHEVEITKAFYMGAYPVTKGQFAAFVQDDGYQTDAEKDGKGGWGLNLATAAWEQKPENTWRHPRFPQVDDHPVVEVSWNDATAFCAWLSKKEGKSYELPTEAEWEYACRAGTTTRFWCGDTDASLKGNANIADASLHASCPGATWAVAWDDGHAFTSPVGTFKANPWGLYDMHGNVWQWCADGYDKYQERYIKDPKGKESANSRVLRGGSWRVDPRNCRSAHRYNFVPAYRFDYDGFRVVLRLPARTP